MCYPFLYCIAIYSEQQVVSHIIPLVSVNVYHSLLKAVTVNAVPSRCTSETFWINKTLLPPKWEFLLLLQMQHYQRDQKVISNYSVKDNSISKLEMW